MWDIVGHSNPIGMLQNVIQNNAVNHAYLFAGPEHIGKAAIAIKFAQTLLCTQTNETPIVPCNECLSCKKVLHENHPDIHVIQKQADSQYILIEQIRTLQSESARTRLEGRYSIFIIEDAHTMNDQAANCLLKTLEEPIEGVIILLTATDASLMLPTILSRVQQVIMHPLPTTKIIETLQAQEHIDQEQAKKIGLLSRGRIGWAIAACRNEATLQTREQLIEDMQHILTEGMFSRIKRAERFSTHAEDVEIIFQEWLVWWRDILLVSNNQQELVSNFHKQPELASIAQRLSAQQIESAIATTVEAMELFQHNVNARVALEHLFLHLPVIAEA